MSGVSGGAGVAECSGVHWASSGSGSGDATDSGGVCSPLEMPWSASGEPPSSSSTLLSLPLPSLSSSLEPLLSYAVVGGAGSGAGAGAALAGWAPPLPFLPPPLPFLPPPLGVGAAQAISAARLLAYPSATALHHHARSASWWKRAVTNSSTLQGAHMFLPLSMKARGPSPGLGGLFSILVSWIPTAR